MHKCRVADKSLARPKKNNLQRPISNFCKLLKKNSDVCPSNQVSAAANTSTSDEKWRPFNCFFSRVGLRIYQHPLYNPVQQLMLLLLMLIILIYSYLCQIYHSDFTSCQSSSLFEEIITLSVSIILVFCALFDIKCRL